MPCLWICTDSLIRYAAGNGFSIALIGRQSASAESAGNRSSAGKAGPSRKGRSQRAPTWAREIEGEMDRGVFVRRDLAESTTLKEFLERYAAEIVPGHKGRESPASSQRSGAATSATTPVPA